MLLSFRELFSSRIDYPQPDLPEDLWDKSNGEYFLKPNVVTSIKNMAESVLVPIFKNVDKWVVTYILGSSVATQFWKEDSDLDIKIVINPEKFKKYNPEYSKASNEELKKYFVEIFDFHKGKEYFKFKNRPLDMYLAIDKEIPTEDYQKRFDALYDVNSNVWIKHPIIYDIDNYDRDKVIEKGETMALNWATKWDLDLGDMKRKIREAELVQKYIESLDPKRALKFKQKVEKLLKSLEKDIKEIHTEKENIKEQYYKVYDDFDLEMGKFYSSVNEVPEVIRIKLLNLWGYLYIIRNLNKFIKNNNEISVDEIDEVKTFLT